MTFRDVVEIIIAAIILLPVIAGIILNFLSRR